MAHYFFDTRDNDTFIEDDVGLEVSTLQGARDIASKSLAELARDVLPGAAVRTLAVEVRDAVGPVLRAVLRFEVQQVREGMV